VFLRYYPDGETVAASGELVKTPPVFPIVLDGDVGDWEGVPIHSDPADATGAAVDLRLVSVAASERHLFLRIDLGKIVNIAALKGTVNVLLDADGNSVSGRTIYGLSGSDLGIELSAAPGSGMYAYWIPSAPAEIHESPVYQAGLRVAPSYASREVELRIDRGASMPGVASSPILLAERAVVKVVFSEDLIARLDFGTSRNIRDETAPIEVTLPPYVPAPVLAADDPSPTADPLARAVGTDFRVLTWNVSGFAAQRREQVGQILRAIDADILMLGEIRGEVSVQEVTQWLQSVLGGDSPQWQVLFGQGTERSLVAVKGDVSEAFGKVNYPLDELEALAPVLESHSFATLDQLMQVFPDRGIGVTGAFATVGERRALVVSLDLTCCGDSPDSPQEAQRMIEARAVRSAIQQVPETEYGGVLVGGDLNLVATRGPLDTLRSGLDRNREALSAVNALDLDGQAGDTWRSVRSVGPFPPARMDWLLFGGSTLEERGGFVFDTRKLSPYWLAHHELAADFSLVSDHLPIVTDFAWR
jgi:hypothetical protein